MLYKHMQMENQKSVATVHIHVNQLSVTLVRTVGCITSCCRAAAPHICYVVLEQAMFVVGLQIICLNNEKVQVNSCFASAWPMTVAQAAVVTGS